MLNTVVRVVKPAELINNADADATLGPPECHEGF